MKARPHRSLRCPKVTPKRALWGISLMAFLGNISYNTPIYEDQVMSQSNLESESFNEGVKRYLLNLQASIMDEIQALDGQAQVLSDVWQKESHEPLQGHGITKIMEGGELFERAGCGFSHVQGTSLPPSATQARPELVGASFDAMGMSLVFHPCNPFVPTVHMNVRMLSALSKDHTRVAWFGGGMDLTPYYGFREDAVHFHQTCKNALAPFGEGLYPRFKKWCDEYFFLKHRQEARGIGGIFFDDFYEFGNEGSFAMLQSVGDAFLSAYLPIVKRRSQTPYTAQQRAHQLYRRGRYVEFNLVWDRGTHFGLQSGGRTESILLSMPPLVSWSYQHQDPQGSPESALLKEFLVPQNWVS